MPALVISAMRARRTQTIAVFVLTTLAALSASAVPWFLAWTHDTVVASDVAAAPIDARVVRVSGTALYQAGESSPLPPMRAQVEQYIPARDSTVTTGGVIIVTVTSTATAGTPGDDLFLGVRDQICAQVVIDGACPTGSDEVILGQSTAQRLHLRVGDSVAVTSTQLKHPVMLRVSGVYAPRDLLSPYWNGTSLLTGPAGALAQQPAPTAFVSLETLLALSPDRISVDYHAVLSPTAFQDGGAALARQLQRATDQLSPTGFAISSSASVLIDAIGTDRRLARAGVDTAAVELVLLSWFVLFIAVRHASVLRRADIGLLKLRGGPRWQFWTLAGQQSAIPMLAGVVVGAMLGYFAAAGPARSRAALHPPANISTLILSLLAAVLVGVGALAAATAAEASALRSPVVSLLRRVPARRSRWRAPAADLAVVALALSGVYQGHADLSTGGEASPLALAAPALVGLAIALVTARALPWAAARAGAQALSTGRAGAALGALQLARRPGTERVFLVVAVAVSVASTSIFFAAGARTAWTARADLELGAARVLVVHAPSSAALLADVRAADPAGRYAMAVAYAASTQTLAVDTTRLSAVALLPRDYGLPDVASVAHLLRPVAPGSLPIRDGMLRLDLAVTGSGTGPVTLTLAYEDAAGQPHAMQVALQDGRHQYQVVISGCTGGCRLVSLEPATSRPRATVSVYAIAQAAGGADGDALGDIRLWRSQVAAEGVGPLIASADGRLDITVTAGRPTDGKYLDDHAYYAGAAVPLPVVAAGLGPVEERAGDPRVTVLGAVDVPYQLVAHGIALPRIGSAGMLMDLEAAQDAIALAQESVSLEIWLAAETPPAIVAALQATGVEIISDTTVADRVAELGAEGPGLALRFQLLVAAVLLLLAGGSLIVAAGVERHDRATELLALRRQGLSSQAMRVAAYSAPLTLVVGAIVTGIVAALVARSSIPSSFPVFSDGWAVLPPGVLTVATLGIATGLAVTVLVPTAIWGAARIVRLVGRG